MRMRIVSAKAYVYMGGSHVSSRFNGDLDHTELVSLKATHLWFGSLGFDWHIVTSLGTWVHLTLDKYELYAEDYGINNYIKLF